MLGVSASMGMLRKTMASSPRYFGGMAGTVASLRAAAIPD